MPLACGSIIPLMPQNGGLTIVGAAASTPQPIDEMLAMQSHDCNIHMIHMTAISNTCVAII